MAAADANDRLETLRRLAGRGPEAVPVCLTAVGSRARRAGPMGSCRRRGEREQEHRHHAEDTELTSVQLLGCVACRCGCKLPASRGMALRESLSQSASMLPGRTLGKGVPGHGTLGCG